MNSHTLYATNQYIFFPIYLFRYISPYLFSIYNIFFHRCSLYLQLMVFIVHRKLHKTMRGNWIKKRFFFFETLLNGEISCNLLILSRTKAYSSLLSFELTVQKLPLAMGCTHSSHSLKLWVILRHSAIWTTAVCQVYHSFVLSVPISIYYFIITVFWPTIDWRTLLHIIFSRFIK